jgi:hypothetical protein
MLNGTVGRRAILVSVLVISGCGFLAPVFGPVHQTSTDHTDQAKDEGYIQFLNTTSDHRIFLDGKPIGSGDDYSNSRVLAVPPGPHMVEVMQGTSTVLSQKVFIGTGSTRAVEVK